MNLPMQGSLAPLEGGGGNFESDSQSEASNFLGLFNFLASCPRNLRLRFLTADHFYFFHQPLYSEITPSRMDHPCVASLVPCLRFLPFAWISQVTCAKVGYGIP